MIQINGANIEPRKETGERKHLIPGVAYGQNPPEQTGDFSETFPCCKVWI